MPELVTRVVRSLGSSRTHVVDVPASSFATYTFIGSTFVGVPTPVATRCGAELRGRDSAAVCMEPGTRVSCSRCRRVSGVTAAGEDNHEVPADEARPR